jgi:hypothetical protein
MKIKSLLKTTETTTSETTKTAHFSPPHGKFCISYFAGEEVESVFFLFQLILDRYLLKADTKIGPEWRAIDVFAVLLPAGEAHVESEDSQKNAILSYISKERIAIFRLGGILFS